MFLSVDSTGKIIAMHDDKEVVEEYNNLIYHYHKIHLNIIKAKKKSLKNKKFFDDLYLVRYGQTYVQAGYLTYIQLASDQIHDDMRFAKDILLRVLEINKLSNKDSKSISKAISIMDDLIYEDEQYTPSITELRNLKNDYDPYIYNYNVYN